MKVRNVFLQGFVLSPSLRMIWNGYDRLINLHSVEKLKIQLQTSYNAIQCRLLGVKLSIFHSCIDPSCKGIYVYIYKYITKYFLLYNYCTLSIDYLIGLKIVTKFKFIFKLKWKLKNHFKFGFTGKMQQENENNIHFIVIRIHAHFFSKIFWVQSPTLWIEKLDVLIFC